MHVFFLTALGASRAFVLAVLNLVIMLQLYGKVRLFAWAPESLAWWHRRQGGRDSVALPVALPQSNQTLRKQSTPDLERAAGMRDGDWATSSRPRLLMNRGARAPDAAAASRSGPRGTEAIRADVRVIAATNRDLEVAIADGTFRADLFYRLNVFPLEVPVLRDRRTDIPLLLEYFAHRYGKRAGKRIGGISKETSNLLQSYDWPGNIRKFAERHRARGDRVRLGHPRDR